MPMYFVNKNAQRNGDHEVHKEDCTFLPESNNRISLGYHSNCKSAVRKAKDYFDQVNGCAFCSVECHTT